MSKKSVAFVQTDVRSGAGVGGAQHFFIDMFQKYHEQPDPAHRLYFITDKSSQRQIRQQAGYEKSGRFVLGLVMLKNRFHDLAGNLDWLCKIIFRRIRLIHICQYYHPTYYRRLRFLQSLPAFIRPKIVVNFIHCAFPYEYDERGTHNSEDYHQRFDPLFNDIKVDGVYSWYVLFKQFVEERGLFKSKPYIHAIETYCCNTSKYRPAAEKENHIVWAARFEDLKNPFFFIDALHALVESPGGKELLKDWKIIVCGKGPYEEEVKRMIADYKLHEFLELKGNVPNMAEIFARSKCFISSQNFENFTSLSMNEAMAAGNAIISRNVGQTSYYVEDGGNGFLAQEDTPQGLADALRRYLSQPGRHEALQRRSLEIIRDVHNIPNFIRELDAFWAKLLGEGRT